MTTNEKKGSLEVIITVLFRTIYHPVETFYAKMVLSGKVKGSLFLTSFLF